MSEIRGEQLTSNHSPLLAHREFSWPKLSDAPVRTYAIETGDIEPESVQNTYFCPVKLPVSPSLPDRDSLPPPTATITLPAPGLLTDSDWLFRHPFPTSAATYEATLVPPVAVFRFSLGWSLSYQSGLWWALSGQRWILSCLGWVSSGLE